LVLQQDLLAISLYRLIHGPGRNITGPNRPLGPLTP